MSSAVSAAGSYTPVLVKGELCQASEAEIVYQQAANDCTLRAAPHRPTLSANNARSCGETLSKTYEAVSTPSANAVDRDFDYSLEAMYCMPSISPWTIARQCPIHETQSTAN